jgi:hypothetical protein
VNGLVGMAKAKQNMISIKRLPGRGPTKVTATFSIEFDPSDLESVDHFARVMRELIPEDERAQFMADFERAGQDAGFKLRDKE